MIEAAASTREKTWGLARVLIILLILSVGRCTGENGASFKHHIVIVVSY